MDKVESETPAASETEQTDSGDTQPEAPAPKVARKAAGPDSDRVSIEDLRKYGLHYEGGGTVAGSHGRMLPASDLEPELAAWYVKDRDTMLAVLATGYYRIADPPADEAKE